MKSRDVIIGFIFLVILIAGVLWLIRIKKLKPVNTPIPSPTISERIDKAFPNLVIPEGTERADLRDVSGGNNIGVATRTEIVANLPTPPSGQVYEGWLEDSSGKQVRLGAFRVSKSGWLLNYDSTKYPGYNKVIIILGQTRVLEGSF